MKRDSLIYKIKMSDFWYYNGEFVIIWFIGFVITMIVGWNIARNANLKNAEEKNIEPYSMKEFIGHFILWSVLWPITWSIGIACGWTGFLESLHKK